ncbi:hypothetical protein BKA67DRAFT_656700 [Truncatella angustata]|uniref:Mannose-1-phosphate guanylyltransferase n=1 Tax=Truncatella angustata TaxID=152316 RepID=A0A9P8USX1_9PEZI|nr:uncharacterized protein BKA67DRAFT_656700 [Truncatella angustata]KAH6658510.1 hypothetical protein BKA67DRAFT_656700 [Truncatella angustata]
MAIPADPKTPNDAEASRHATSVNPNRIGFDSQKFDFAQARERCAGAMLRFNFQPADIDPVDQITLWLDVVDPARTRHPIATGGSVEPIPRPPRDIRTYDQALLSAATGCDVPRGWNPVIPNIQPPLVLEYGLRVRIHPSAFLNYGCKILDTPVSCITIGANCMLGPGVSLNGARHALPATTDGHRGTYGGPITIEDDVWISGHCIIL